MVPNLRKSQIKRLADAIALIGPDFEAFGGALMTHYLPIELIHPGLNEDGFAVGYTVDTVDQDGEYVAEYSAQQGYFQGDMPKADKDLRHAIDREPRAKIIYLLSSSRLKNGPVRAFKSKVRAWPDMAERRVRIWGGVEIARIVLRLLFDDRAVQALAPYLPQLTQILDEATATLQAPAVDGRHVDLPVIDKAISERLRASPCVVLYGIAGAGKSAAAAAFADLHGEDYALKLWINGAAIDRIEALSVTPLWRGGASQNVTNLLATVPCLVILDDVEVALDSLALAALCGAGSAIIVTQRAASTGAFEIPPLGEDIARQLLDRDASAPCPPEIFEIIWRTAGGHPLTLGLMNAAVRNGAPWSDIGEDCEAVWRLTDDRGELLADRVLDRIRKVMEIELSAFQWAGQARCDRRFLKAAIQPLGVRKLGENSLTAIDRPTTVRLHEMVFAALKGEPASPANDVAFTDQLESYISKVSQENTFDFWTVSTTHRVKLEALARQGDRRPAFLYALLETWTPGQVDPDLLTDPVDAVGRLETVGVAERMAVMAIIETIEKGYLYDKAALGSKTAKERLTAALPVFDRLAALPGLSERQKVEIEHHRGKALLRADQRLTAIALFEHLLTLSLVLPETKQQLLRLYAKDETQSVRVEGWTREILDGAAKASVGRSLVLATIESLPWGDAPWRATLIAQRKGQISALIISAAEAGMPQAYRTFASMGRYWTRTDPDAFVPVLDAVPPWSAQADLDDDDRSAYGEVLLEAARLSANAAARRTEALSFFESISRPSNYHQQRHAELLLDMGRPADAEAKLLQIPSLTDNAFQLRLLARARLDLDDAVDALTVIDKALSLLKAQRFRGEFLGLRHQIRTALRDPDAVDDLREAVAQSPDGPERQKLQADLAAIEPPEPPIVSTGGTA